MSWHVRSASLAIVIDDASVESIRTPMSHQTSDHENEQINKLKRLSRRSKSVAISQTANHSMASPTLSFTAALTVRRMAQASKILTHLKKCPLFYDPSFTQPASQQTQHIANRAVLLHKLSRHPSVALLQYPPRTAIIVQSSHPTLVHLLVSGRIRSIRAGLALMESLSGELIGADCAVFSSESFRRWHRSMLRQRVALNHGDSSSMMNESINRMNHDVDIREFEFESEFKSGVRKRRRAFLAPMSVECIDPCEVLVLPKDLLLELVHSSHSLRLHTYQHLLAVHWMRRNLYEEAEARVSRVYGAHIAQDGHPATERSVLGSTGFLVHSIIKPSSADQENALAEAQRKISATLDVESHPMCGINRTPGSSIRIKLAANQTAQGGTRGAERQRKRTIKEKAQSEQRADKVKSIISAMQHQRRVSLAANMRLAQEEHEDDPDAQYESESEEDEDSPIKPSRADSELVLDRYLKAVHEQTVVNTPSVKSKFMQRVNHHILAPDKQAANDDKPRAIILSASTVNKQVKTPSQPRPVAKRHTGPFVLHPIVDEDDDEADECSFDIDAPITQIRERTIATSPSVRVNDPEEVKLTPVPRINLLLATSDPPARHAPVEPPATTQRRRSHATNDNSPFVVSTSRQPLGLTHYRPRTPASTDLTEEQKECIESVIDMGESKRPYNVPINATKPAKASKHIHIALKDLRAQQQAREMSKLKFPLPHDRATVSSHASTTRDSSSISAHSKPVNHGSVNGSLSARTTQHNTPQSSGSFSARTVSSDRRAQEMLAAASQRHLPWSTRLAYLHQAANSLR